MIETLAFVALIALGSIAVGVLVGRYYVPDDRALKRSAQHGEAYLRTVQRLLARDRDAAIDELRRVVEDDVDDLEPYFALASLFRSRGEWERAIRVHQAIELRGSQDAQARMRSLYELGLDFRSAGMPRRAIKAMEECLLEDTGNLGALRALTGLYEQQCRFADAAEAWHRLGEANEGRLPREAHLLAAAAERSRRDGDLSAAKEHSKAALRLDGAHAHALVIAAGVARDDGDAALSRRYLLAALRVRPDLASVVAPDLVKSFAHGEGDDSPEKQAVVALSEVAADLDNAALELAAAEQEAQFDASAAAARLDRASERHSAQLPLRIRAARLALAANDEEAVRIELERLVGEEGALAHAVVTRWRCGSCGAVDEEFYWHCPSCRHWDSMAISSAQAQPPSRLRERRQFSRDRGGSLLVATEADANAGAGDGEPRSSSVPNRARGWLSGAVDSLRRKS